MKKIISIIGLVFMFFLIEFLIFNLAGRSFMPNFMILFIIFVSLSLGIRYSIFTAVIAGVVKDSFGVGVFGIHSFSFIVCAYLTILFKKYVYHVTSFSSRLLLVFIIVVSNVVIQFFLKFMFGSVSVRDALRHVLLPEVVMTLIVANFTFERLKACASRLFA